MARTFDLNVLTPDHPVYSGLVTGLIAPGYEGYLGVLAHHAPMVVQLTIGMLTVSDEQEKRRVFALSGGFLEVTQEGVTILADTAEEAGAINVERARAAQERATRRLISERANIDVARAEAAFSRALNRLQVAAKAGSITIK